MAGMLRVHSQDLHEHVASEAGECLESGLYTDLALRCHDGHILRAHRIVLAAVSPYLRQLLATDEPLDIITLDLPDAGQAEVRALLEIVYTGSLEATMEEMRRMLILAHSLYISVPVSDQLMKMLGLSLPPLPTLKARPAAPPPVPELAPTFPPMAGLGSLGQAGMTLLQQQILSQYALMNGLMGQQQQQLQHHQQNQQLQQIQQQHQQQSQAIEPPAKKIKTSSSPPLSIDNTKDLMSVHINQVILQSYKPTTGSYVCGVCQSSYTNKGNFKQHAEKHFKNGEFAPQNGGGGLAPTMVPQLGNFDSGGGGSLYQCHICQSTYSHPGNFKQHLLKHEREQRNMSSNVEGNHLNSVLQSAFADRVDNGDPCKSYVCHDCNRTFKHPGNFKQHMASHNKPVVTHPPPLPMPPPPPSPEAMSKKPMPGLVKVDPAEVEERGGGGRVWECPECVQKFITGRQLQAHMKSLHNIEMVLPPEGPQEVEEERAVSPPLGDAGEGMKALALAAGADRLAMFNCDASGCFQSFTSEGWLARHRARTHSDAPSPGNGAPSVYSCNQCGKEFFKLSKLTQHVKTHSPEVHYKYPCDICGKKFTRPQHVTRHKLLHTGERPHTCPRDNCDKSFAREDKLKHHLIKGCPPELDQSIDSRDSGDEGSPGEVDMGEGEIDDDEEGQDEDEEEDRERMGLPKSNMPVGVMG